MASKVVWRPEQTIYLTELYERYFERRRRNNLAAKKSRDQRRFREEVVAQRAETLERENAVLRLEVTFVNSEL